VNRCQSCGFPSRVAATTRNRLCWKCQPAAAPHPWRPHGVSCPDCGRRYMRGRREWETCLACKLTPTPGEDVGSVEPVEFDMDAWLRQHPEVANLGRCRGVKRDGERCTSKRRPGSAYCGVHAKGRQ
jgi:hypothetical protein